VRSASFIVLGRSGGYGEEAIGAGMGAGDMDGGVFAGIQGVLSGEGKGSECSFGRGGCVNRLCALCGSRSSQPTGEN